MVVNLLTEHQFELLSLKGECTGSSESTLVKMPHCWKSRVAAQICFVNDTWSVILTFPGFTHFLHFNVLCMQRPICFIESFTLCNLEYVIMSAH